MKSYYVVVIFLLIIGQLKANDDGLKKIYNKAYENTYTYYRNGVKIAGYSKKRQRLVQVIYYRDQAIICFMKDDNLDTISMIKSLAELKDPSVVFSRKEGKINKITIYDANMSEMLESYDIINDIIKPASDQKLKQMQQEWRGIPDKINEFMDNLFKNKTKK